MTEHIIDTTLKEASRWGNPEYMEEGLVLTDSIPAGSIPNKPTRLNFIMLALCRQGSAQYSIDTTQQTVNPGDLFFVSERHIVDSYTATPDFECLCIMVSTPFYHSFVQNVKNVSSLLLFSRNNPVVTLTPKEQKVFADYYKTIREKMADQEHHYRLELVKSQLLAMYYDMSNVIWRIEQQGDRKQSRADVLFAQFIHLLEENYKSERFVSWYAKKLYITPKYLSDICKQVSKRTANEWIDNYVVLELRVQLKNSSKTIKEITEELNFPNQSFLGKYFKEHVGMSPSDYRKN